MSFIDDTYFYGDLSIAQKSSDADNLAWYMDEYERSLLTKLLGYELSRDFKAGLLADPVPQKWLDLLYGVEYADLSGKLTKWDGFLEVSSSVNPGTYIPGDIEVIINSSLAGLSTWSHPTGFLTGKSFRVIRRGVGNLGSDVTVNSNGFTLPGDVFVLGDRYYIEFIAPIPLPAGGTAVTSPAKISLIANYVFYYYSQSNRTASTGTGEKQVSAANAINASALDKEVKAWNKMVHKNRDLANFLIVKATDYPAWDRWFYDMRKAECSEQNKDNPFSMVNSLGL